MKNKIKIEAYPLLLGISDSIDEIENELDPQNKNRNKHVAFFAYQCAKALDCSQAECDDLFILGLLHNITLHHQKQDLRYLIQAESILSKLPMNTLSSEILLAQNERPYRQGSFAATFDALPKAAQILSCASAFGRERKEIQGLYPPTLVDVMRQSQQDEAWLSTFQSIFQERFAFTFFELEKEDLIPLFEVFSELIDAKSKTTKHHSRTVMRIGQILFEDHQYPDAYRLDFTIACLLHDYGKMFIPQAILEKAGPLTKAEFIIMKQHVVYTIAFLNQFSAFSRIAYWAGAHHEKLDGSGYPSNLHEQDLDFYCRLIAVIDLFVALTENRTYHRGKSGDEVLVMLADMVARHKLDAQAVHALTLSYHDHLFKGDAS